MASKSFTINNITYTGLTASAMEQDEIMSLISPVTMQRIFTSGEGLDVVQKLTLMYLSLPQNIKQTVANLLTAKVSVNGSTASINIKDFENNMIAWNTLLAELTYWNFADFFTYLANVLEKDKLSRQAVTAS